MTDSANTRIVKKAYEDFGKGDIQGLLGALSEDVHWQLPDIENVPFSGARRGRAAVAQFFTMLNEAQEALQFEPRHFVAEGDTVVALGHYTWRVRASGRRFESDWAHVFTVRDGRVVRFQEYTDSAVAAAAHRKT